MADMNYGALLRMCKQHGKGAVIASLERIHAVTWRLIETADEHVTMRARNELLQRWEKQERTINYLKKARGQK